MDFHVLELVSDFSTTTGQLVPKADGEVRPSLGIGRVSVHTQTDEGVRGIDAKAWLS